MQHLRFPDTEPFLSLDVEYQIHTGTCARLEFAVTVKKFEVEFDRQTLSYCRFSGAHGAHQVNIMSGWIHMILQVKSSKGRVHLLPGLGNMARTSQRQFPHSK